MLNRRADTEKAASERNRNRSFKRAVYIVALVEAIGLAAFVLARTLF
ncbi:MAG TPA: hypothetical protein VLD57_01225 [Blastocatellia bacterium]|nr:hypothetical protein [Blastocatellia bacterium]